MGNVTRFEKSRGLDQILSWFCDEEIKNTFTLDIIGAGQSSFKKLEEKIEKLDLSNVVNISGRLSRKNAISSMKRFSTGLLINSPDNPHSYLYTSPIKYFEYLYGGLNILAVDFPSHRSLPLSENISFFQNGDFKSFKNALFDCKTIKPISRESLNSITLDFYKDRIWESEEFNRISNDPNVLEAFKSLINNPDIPGKFHTNVEDKSFGKLDRFKTNPLTVDSFLSSYGFKWLESNFYHFHAVPPLISDKVKDLKKINHFLELNFSSDWRANFMCPMYLVIAEKKDL